MKVVVLALQGPFIEHIAVMQQLGKTMVADMKNEGVEATLLVST